MKLFCYSDSSTSFTSLGKQLGSSLRELHRCLVLSLLSEKLSVILVRVLQTLELLMENVQYSNLKSGLLTKVITHVKYFLRCKGESFLNSFQNIEFTFHLPTEATVRANAYSLMVSFLMIKPQSEEIREILTKYQAPAPKELVRPIVDRPPSPLEELAPDEDLDEYDTEFSLVNVVRYLLYV